MRLLTVSDEIVRHFHSAQLRASVGEIDAIVGCGDLPPSYLEYLVTMLNVPCMYVPGNHDAPELRSDGSYRHAPQGCDSLDGRVRMVDGLLFAGVGGVLWYRDGKHQYSERAWFRRMLLLMVRVRLAQQRYKCRLDVLVTHTPPQGLHDGEGAHRGPLALRRFVERMEPRYVLHGHVHHCYGYGDQSPLQFRNTTIVNTCGYTLLEIQPKAALREVSVS